MIDNFNNTLETSAPEVSGLLTKLQQRDWRNTLRSPIIFFSPRYFSKPRTSVEATTRIEHNITFYLTNYMIICMIITLFSILSEPTILILIVILGFVWNYSMKQEVIHIGSTALSGRTKMITLATITGLLVFIFAGSVIFSIVGLCSCIVLAHSLFNDRGGINPNSLEYENESNNAEIELNVV